MEAIITIVGFLGSGKTTLLNFLIDRFSKKDYHPFVILNDYENAQIDIQQFLDKVDNKYLKALSGSCICCSGINELRNYVNGIPTRKNGITLIEANGTSDACSLMEFLGVGVNDRFLPPIQIAVVDVKNWQNRGEFNDLEANQVQVSSLIVLTHLENASEERKNFVINNLKEINPYAKISTINTLDLDLLLVLSPSKNVAERLEHQKAHWTSCSIDLPVLPNIGCIEEICKKIPKSILRVKGCAKIMNQENYTYFERVPDGNVFVRPFRGIPITGTKLLTIGAGSDPSLLEKIIKSSILNK
ncbi:GTP-binding protein [Polaribacter sargassicola]|uniref:GTP-binding protein n=1 Tax=Polaribacter sargassicola TaxID=2836891 RepID=UPI001F48E13E|nr:GTP-binding protein [Polaribacter sp. DS7-9]MCG1036816.1 cobalamin biosynthesis protein CobW [Polaribacter sp. DS7-9]